MQRRKIRQKDLVRLGYPKGKLAALAVNILRSHFRRTAYEEQLTMAQAVLAAPADFLQTDCWSVLAEKMVNQTISSTEGTAYNLLPNPQPYTTFTGQAGIAENARQQMHAALQLPVAVTGALMPDAHHGYGLPIGGVLATQDVVIPYGVGMDIGCRMCLSIYDLPGDIATTNHDRLAKLLMEHTAFGEGGVDQPMDDPVLQSELFKDLPNGKRLRDKAYRQIGSSGRGNHFVEFGVAALPAGNQWQVPAGHYLALLSHSGSRGLGANLAKYFTQLAMQETKLPKAVKHLAWLSLSTDAGRAYWAAMSLAGDYATACHNHIHLRMKRALQQEPIVRVANHHNFAWREQLADGREVIVHRKGATPAKQGELGIIPGSMTAPGYIVAGKGVAASLQSASHGAGRKLSRTAAKQSFTRNGLKSELKQQGVTLIGGGLDEAPGAYKDIRAVMQDQAELVDILGVFHPKVVRMA